MALQGTFVGRVERAIREINEGKMVILVDDEDRENEGDLVLAADLVTPEAVNFMAVRARGLICVTLTEEQVQRLGLAMMVEDNRSSRSTAFTVSIEAREGVTTGISAHDRAQTIRVAASPVSVARDIVSPGHVFPLRARTGGVLQRTGHTEGSVDLVRLAGRTPAAVICEIMNDDGTMARLPDLQQFAEKHGVHILTIEDLVHYRLQRDRLVRRIESLAFRPAGFRDGWQAHVYEAIESRQYLALSLGEPSQSEPSLVRMHAGAIFADLFALPPAGHPAGHGSGAHLFEAMHMIEQAGHGVVVYIPPTHVDLVGELRARANAHAGDTAMPTAAPAQREFGLGAQVLVDLGLKRIRIMTNNPRRFVGLAGYGLEVVAQVPLTGTAPVRSGG